MEGHGVLTMPLWPLPEQVSRYANQRGTNAGSLGTVNVPTGGSAHTKGAWTQLAGSTAIDAQLLRLYLGGHNSSGAASPALLDIGVGASGSEQVLVPDLDIGFHALPLLVTLPAVIPRGSRLAARAQGARTATNIATALDIEGDQNAVGLSIPAVTSWTAYGVDTANSRGTSVTPGSSNSWGSWVSLGTTTADHEWWFAMMDMGADTAVTAVTYRVQIAVAANTTAATAAATAVELQADQVWATTTSETVIAYSAINPCSRRAPTASGTVYARAACSGTARTIYVAAYAGG